jgi:HEAT repeat protein
MTDNIARALARLQDPDAWQRAQVAMALSNLRDARVVAAMAQALRDDSDPTVRANAALCLGVNRAHEHERDLLSAMHDRNEIVRERAATALAQLGTPDALHALINGLDDTHAFVRNRCAYLLGASRHANAIDPLMELLNHRDASSRSVAAWALGVLTAREAVPALLRLLQDSAPVVRGNAAWALGEFADESLIPPLIGRLKDTSPDVRAKAAWALGALGSATASTAPLAPLIRLLDDYAEVQDDSAHIFVCQYAAEALTQLQTPPALEAVARWRPEAQARLAPYRVREMIRAFAHPQAETRESALQAVIAMGEDVVPLLIDALKHRHPRVRGGAVRALGLLKAREAVPMLLLALADDDLGVWSQAVAALGAMGEETLLTSALKSDKTRVKHGAALALWRLARAEAAFPYVLIVARDNDVIVQTSAVTSLWLQPDERATATLQAVLTPEDTMLNRYVVQALQAIKTPLAVGIAQRWVIEVLGQG